MSQSKLGAQDGMCSAHYVTSESIISKRAGSLGAMRSGVAHLWADTDTHGRELERALQDGVPHEQVAVKAEAAVRALGDPVIVVRRTAVVAKRHAVLLVTANAHQEDRTVLLAQHVLALLGRQVWVLFQHLVRREELNFLRQHSLQTELLGYLFLGIDNSLVDALNGGLQVLHVTVLCGDDLLPIPLVDVERMREVDVIIAAQAAHVGHKALAGRELIVVERPPLPLGERERDLELDVLEVARSEGGRTLNTVKIVVEAGVLGEEQRRRDALQVDVLLELLLEGRLDCQ
eukprot:6213851-Pleurochrysis_carterae.AAC.3